MNTLNGNIVIIGPPGNGKFTFTQAWLADLGIECENKVVEWENKKGRYVIDILMGDNFKIFFYVNDGPKEYDEVIANLILRNAYDILKAPLY